MRIEDIARLVIVFAERKLVVFKVVVVVAVVQVVA